MHNITFEKFSQEVEKYKSLKKEFENLFDVYKEVSRVQFRYGEKIDVPFHFEEGEEINNYLREGNYLLNDKVLDIDIEELKEIMTEIAHAVFKDDIKASEKVEKLKQLPIFEDNVLSELLQNKGGITPEYLEKYLREQNIEIQDDDIEPEIIIDIFFAALSPYYMNYANKANEITDFALWSSGYCPVCGQKPMMAKLRRDNSARVLECWLCHTQWEFSRLECPYCNNRDHYKLGYFYVEEEKARRINICEKCKSYLKTVNLKEIGREVILDVENVFTVDLDSAAQERGYKPGQDLSLLN